MSDPPKILDPPSPPPRRFVTAILNLIALILLLTGQTRPGIIAVALGFVSSLFDIFTSRSEGPRTPSQRPQGPTAGTV